MENKKFGHEKHRRNVMITDLDQSDSQLVQHQLECRPEDSKKRNPAKCLRTISGNFKRRSRSAECSVGQEQEVNAASRSTGAPTSNKTNNYFNELLHSKDKQMEQLLQRLATLHKFNEQFADENKSLRDDVDVLDQKLVQLKQRIKNCLNCRKLQTQLESAMETSKTVNNDIAMLKTLVYRLNVQIEYYQDRLRNAANNNTNASPNAPTATPPDCTAAPAHTQWADAIHTPTLAPLLKSYDEMLKDKQELIQQYKQEFETFTGELKSVLEENRRLLQANESLKRDYGAWREERTRLQAQADVSRAKAEAQSRKSDLAKEKLVEVMHCYEQKMQSIVLDMEHLQAAYTRCKSELASLKSLSVQPHESIAQSLQECKELLEQLKTQHSREKSSLEKQVLELREQQAGGMQNLLQLKATNTELKQALDLQLENGEELRRRLASTQRIADKVKRSRDRLKARLRIALQWAQKLEEGQANMQNTWDALKRLESIVKHKESQVRGLHARHVEELDKMQQKLEQKEETIRKILKGKLSTASVS